MKDSHLSAKLVFPDDNSNHPENQVHLTQFVNRHTNEAACFRALGRTQMTFDVWHGDMHLLHCMSRLIKFLDINPDMKCACHDEGAASTRIY